MFAKAPSRESGAGLLFVGGNLAVAATLWWESSEELPRVALGRVDRQRTLKFQACAGYFAECGVRTTEKIARGGGIDGLQAVRTRSWTANAASISFAASAALWPSISNTASFMRAKGLSSTAAERR